MQARPVPSIAPKNRWPVNGMEINVVLSHELIKADVVWVQPPPFPFGRIAGGDAWVPNTGVKLVWGSFPTPS